jgi:hypothetical protein
MHLKARHGGRAFLLFRPMCLECVQQQVESAIVVSTAQPGSVPQTNSASSRRGFSLRVMSRRFPPPWTVEADIARVLTGRGAAHRQQHCEAASTPENRATGSTPDVALRESLWAIGFGRNLWFFAEPFEVRVGLSFRLIGVSADLRHGWVLACRLNINNKAHAVSRPNNPPVRKGRSKKNCGNKTGAD